VQGDWDAESRREGRTDICRQVDLVPYPLTTEDDLAETADLVRAVGRRVVTAVADVRDLAGMRCVVAGAVAVLGRSQSPT